MFSVGNVYLGHLKFYAVCINGRRYVCCSECYCVSNECDEPTSDPVQPFDAHGDEFMHLGELGFLDCDDICMCVVNKHFELLEFVLISFMLTCSVCDEIYLTFTAGYVCLCGVYNHVVALGLSMRLSRYPMSVILYERAVTVMRVLLFVLHVCMLRDCVRVPAILVWGMWL